MRVIIAMLVGLAGLGPPVPGGAAEYPTRPVEVIVPYAAGGGVDVTARVLAENLKKHLPQPFIVVNKTGGGGAIGFTAGAQARPDGYSLIMISNSALSDEFLVRGVTYTYRSYTPIAQVAFDPAVLVVRKGGPHDRPLPQFLATAQEQPGKVKVGFGGNWSVQDLTRAVLEKEAKVKFIRVPFAGGRPAVVALLGGHIDAAVAYTAEFIGQYESGELSPLAVTGSQRSPFLPDVPTFKEAGLKVEVGVWRIVAGPAGLSPAIVGAVERAIRQTLEDPATQDAYRKAKIPVVFRSAVESADYLRAQHVFYQELVKEFGLQPQ